MFGCCLPIVSPGFQPAPAATSASAMEELVADEEFYESLKGKYEVTGDVFSTGRKWDAQS